MGTGFAIIWITLLLGPLIAIPLVRIAPSIWPIVGAGLIVLLAAIAWRWSGLRFVAPLANSVGIALSYLAYCFVAASGLRIRSKALRALVLIVAMVPVLCGYALGTVGILGLAFIAAELEAAPSEAQQVSPDMICDVASWGSALSDSGYTVRLYRRWVGDSLVRREVAAFTVNMTAQQSELSCADAYARYRAGH